MQATTTIKKHVVPFQSTSIASTADQITQQQLALKLEQIFNYETPSDFTLSAMAPSIQEYLLPLHTLLLSEAQRLGVSTPQDLYGGVVPYEFTKAKVVSHPLQQVSMEAPTGWAHELGHELRPYTLKGYSAFSVQDAFWVARGLVHEGPIRIKLAHSNASQGQFICTHYTDIAALLQQAAYEPLIEKGVVIEENLTDSTTYSVGQTEVAGLVISYIGEQRATLNLAKKATYGGTRLLAVRGDYEQLRQHLDAPLLLKILEFARQYEQRIFSYYPTLFASRRNYDVIHGRSWDGEMRLGVLEQSWRMGGASMAELYALEALLVDPTLQSQHAWTQEHYTPHLEQGTQSSHVYCLAQESNGYLIKSGGLG